MCTPKARKASDNPLCVRKIRKRRGYLASLTNKFFSILQKQKFPSLFITVILIFSAFLKYSRCVFQMNANGCKWMHVQCYHEIICFLQEQHTIILQICQQFLCFFWTFFAFKMNLTSAGAVSRQKSAEPERLWFSFGLSFKHSKKVEKRRILFTERKTNSWKKLLKSGNRFAIL